MEIFAAVFNFAYEILNIPINAYGFTFSLWSVLIFSVVAGILLWLVFSVLEGK